MKWLLIVLVLATTAIGWAQPGAKTEEKAILKALNPALRRYSAVDLKLKSQHLKVQSGWAFAVVGLEGAHGEEGDGVGMGLLEKVRGKWVVRAATIGSSGLPEIVTAWRRKFSKAPATIFKTKPGTVPPA